MRFRFYFVLLFSFAFCQSLAAEDIPSKLRAGKIFDGISVAAEEFAELEGYARNPAAEQSARILDLIIEKCPSLDLDFLRSKHVIAFLSIGGISQVVHIGKSSRISLSKQVIKKHTVDPDEIQIHARDFVAVWIADDAGIYSTSVEVDITRSTRSLHLSSFESPPLFGTSTGRGEQAIIQIGMRYFKIPIDYGNLDIAFVRRDVETYEKLTWSRSFQILNLPSVLNVGFETGVFVPMSDRETERYEIASNVIRQDKIEPVAFLTLTFFTPAERRFSRGIFENIIPDPLIGIGLPIDLDQARKNSYMFGFGWRFKSDLVRLCVGFQFGEKLLDGYQVGDTATEGERIAEKYSVEPMIGISISITYISELLTGI